MLKMKAKDVMTREVVSVTTDVAVGDVAERLLRHQLSGLPVVDEQGRLVGIVSEYDLLKMVYNLEETRDTIDRHMTKRVKTVDVDAPLTDVADVFLSSGIRRMPVVDAEGTLVGIVARRDLIQAIFDARQRVEQELQRRREQHDVAVQSA